MNRGVATFGMALALDLALGEPPNRAHPVAWLGNAIAAADGRLPAASGRQRLFAGTVLAAGFPAAVALLAILFRGAIRVLPAPAALVLEALALKQAFAVRALFRHAAAVGRPLELDDLPAARHAVSMLVSRETNDLSAAGVASAAIESLSENSSDSAFAPWFWFAVGGLPAAFAYRAVNTLDAMVGYRHRGLAGMPSARLDDVLNYVPARLTAAAIVVASGRVPARLAQRAARDAGMTPSPNSGWPMSAAAHALGLRLEKRGHHVLNAGGGDPEAKDIGRAAALIGRSLALGAAATFVALSLREVSR